MAKRASLNSHKLEDPKRKSMRIGLFRKKDKHGFYYLSGRMGDYIFYIFEVRKQKYLDRGIKFNMKIVFSPPTKEHTFYANKAIGYEQEQLDKLDNIPFDIYEEDLL